MKIHNTTVQIALHRYYHDNNLCISLIDTSDNCVYGNITVNLQPLNPNMAAIDTNNIPEAEEFIKTYELGKDTGIRITSGFCTYPVYEFDMDKLNELNVAKD